MWWRLSKIKGPCWGWQWPRSSKHSGSFLFIPDFQKKNQIITAMEFGISGKERWFLYAVNLVCLFSTSTNVLIDQCTLLIISRTLSYDVLWLSTGWVTRMPWVLGVAFLIVSVTMRSYSFLQTKPLSNFSFFQVSFRHCFPVYGLCSSVIVLARWTLYFPLFSSSIGKLQSRESTFWDGDAFPFEILISVIFSLSLSSSFLSCVFSSRTHSWFIHSVSSHPFGGNSLKLLLLLPSHSASKLPITDLTCACMSFGNVIFSFFLLLFLTSCSSINGPGKVWPLQGP